jgi:predicted cobalt transporter CbtA
LVAFAVSFRVAAFFAFAVFLLAFRFEVSVLVVVSCVLIVVLLLLGASDDTFITPVPDECEAQTEEKDSFRKGLDK